MTAPIHEIKNEMFFLFHRCAARGLGLFRKCSGNVPRNERNNPGTSGRSLLFPSRSVAPTGFWRRRNKRNTAARSATPSASPFGPLACRSWVRLLSPHLLRAPSHRAAAPEPRLHRGMTPLAAALPRCIGELHLWRARHRLGVARCRSPGGPPISGWGAPGLRPWPALVFIGTMQWRQCLREPRKCTMADRPLGEVMRGQPFVMVPLLPHGPALEALRSGRLHPRDMAVLWILLNNFNPLTGRVWMKPSELAEAMGHKSSCVVMKAIGRLKREGLVARGYDKVDTRRWFWALDPFAIGCTGGSHRRQMQICQFQAAQGKLEPRRHPPKRRKPASTDAQAAAGSGGSLRPLRS